MIYHNVFYRPACLIGLISLFLALQTVELRAAELEAPVTIQQPASSIDEFRINGQLYMVKISPRKGYPYYLIDNDGDGDLESRSHALGDPPVPQWVLIRW
ncbi:MAG: DUF2782 domain-containing protein [Gammaproteobacteria bacterium]|nr:DUF2782 domain-containing protein [Gammaproteobacteria bacterium]